jgi:hypothetical protein
MSHDFFVSYARLDHDLVLPLYDALVARGAKVWMDTYHLKDTTPWRPEVIAAIRDARAVLVAVTPTWRRSKACRQELTIARGERRRLFAVVLRPAPPPFDAELVEEDVDAWLGQILAR